MADAHPAAQAPDEMPTPTDSYAAAFATGMTEAERRRLDLQAAMYGRLTAWTLDAPGRGPEQS